MSELEYHALKRKYQKASKWSEQCQQSSQLIKCQQKWEQLFASLRRNENIFEHFLQGIVPMVLFFMGSPKYSGAGYTATVDGLQSIFYKVSSYYDERGYPVVSFDLTAVFLSIWSLVTIVRGAILYYSAFKRGFFGLGGKFIYGCYCFAAIWARFGCVFMFFVPYLGLLGVLGHWKTGKIPAANTSAGYPIVYDINDSKPTFFRDIWNQTANYEDYTVLSFEWAFVSLSFLTLISMGLIFAVKRVLIENFAVKRDILPKLFHVAMNLIIPIVYKEWDEYQGQPLAMFKRQRIEQFILIVLFNLSNCILLIPLFGLNFAIRKRHEYLLRYFKEPLYEETNALSSVSLLIGFSIICLIAMPIVSQVLLTFAFERFGHPWAKLLQLEKANHEKVSKTRQKIVGMSDLRI